MSTVNQIEIPAGFRTEPDLSECYARTVEASSPAVEAAAANQDLVGPLVEGLLALGVAQHIVTPCPNGLIWRFDAGAPGRIRLAWAVSVEPETDDASLVTFSVRATASDAASRERLLDAWPVIGPIVEHHAHRILRSIEALADEEAELRELR